MNIQSHIDAAWKKFSYLEGEAEKQVVEKYASQERGLTDDALDQFVDNATSGDLLIETQEEMDRFATWYALDYGIVNNWNISIHACNLESIDDIRVYPMRQYEEEGCIHVRKCENKDADIYSVYACSKNEEYCIADCKDNLTAILFESLLRTIITNWKINVVIDNRQIITTHSLNCMWIDRHEFANQKGQKSIPLTRVHENARIGELYQHLPFMTSTELQIRKCVKDASF